MLTSRMIQLIKLTQIIKPYAFSGLIISKFQLTIILLTYVAFGGILKIF